MDEPTKTIHGLIERIDATPHDGQGVESQAHAHLTRLLSAMTTGNHLATERCIARLHHFWLESVPWCMPLSKDLEKLLIQLEEQERK